MYSGTHVLSTMMPFYHTAFSDGVNKSLALLYDTPHGRGAAPARETTNYVSLEVKAQARSL